MHYLKYFSVTAAMLAMAITGLGLAVPSHAGPLHTADLNASGDNLLTVDTNTGLEFLDVTATQGQSYNQILHGDFVTQDGFNFATNDQLAELFSDAGITNLTGNFSAANEPALDMLVDDFLGSTVTAHPFTLPIPGFKAQIGDGNYGFSIAPGTPAGMANVAGLDYKRAADTPAGVGETGRAIFNLTTFPKDMAGPAPDGNTQSIVGGFLVRSANATAVPEPSVLGLMGLGLALLGVFSRRRRH